MKAKKDNRSTSSVSPTKEMYENQQFKEMYQVPQYEHGISVGGYKQSNLNFLDQSNGYSHSVTDNHLIQFNNYKV